MKTEPLTCREFVELVTDYLEDALPSEERAAFEQHLAACDGCDIYLQQMRQTVSLVGTLTEDDLSTDAQNRLLAVFRDWTSKPPAE